MADYSSFWFAILDIVHFITKEKTIILLSNSNDVIYKKGCKGGSVTSGKMYDTN